MSSSEKKGRLYLIRNLVNGKGYIGQTINLIQKRFSQHKADAKRGSRFALHCAMRTYGFENFSIQEIVHCELQFINSLEEFCITFFGTKAGKHGYNMAAGGHGTSGWSHSEQTKLKIAATKRGTKLSPEHIKKSASGKLGKKYRSFKNQILPRTASGRIRYVN